MNNSNKYWTYLESLKKSGIINMYGAAPYLVLTFDISLDEAKDILADWMKNRKSGGKKNEK